MSLRLNISKIIIGMTVVSFGTSMPELLVSVNSAVAGNPGIAIGNVVGSNIANIALVLGLAVILLPIIADEQTKKVDYPMMLVSSVLFYLVALVSTVSLQSCVTNYVVSKPATYAKEYKTDAKLASIDTHKMEQDKQLLIN